MKALLPPTRVSEFLCAAMAAQERDARAPEHARRADRQDALATIPALFAVVVGSIAMVRSAQTLGDRWHVPGVIVGTLVLATTPAGLARLAYVDGDEDAVLEELAARLSPRILSAPARLDEPRRELEEYFNGRRRRFDVPLDLRLMTDFSRRVLTATAAIPYGAVSSYREVAERAGSPRGFRATGNALGSNPLPIVLPCHRVLSSGGGLGGYTGGTERKRTLLAIESGQPPA